MLSPKLKFKNKESITVVSFYLLTWQVVSVLRIVRVTIKTDKLRVQKLISHFLV